MATEIGARVERLVTRKEAGVLLSLSESTLKRREAAGKLTPLHDGRRAVRYRLSEVLALFTGPLPSDDPDAPSWTRS